MQPSLPDTVTEVVALAFDVLLTLALTAVGLSAELHGLQLLGSNLTMALWFGYMGIVALYAGVVVIGGKRVLGRLTRSSAGST